MAVTMNYGAAPTYVKIASQTLASTAASVTFSNIPQGYTDLVLVMSPRTTLDGRDLRIQFNGDTSTNYSTTVVGAYTSATSVRTSSIAYIQIGNYIGTSSTQPSTTITNIFNYSNSSIFKTSITKHAQFQTNVNSGYSEVLAQANLWRSTAAITSITISLSSSTYVTGSTFTIYGIKAALFPKATGGDFVVQDGQYWYHAFRTTGAFVPRQALSCDVLVIAGGGSGGNNYSGGGGGGGVFYATAQSISTAQTATVGAGGSNANGSNSTFASLTAAVGGGKGGAGENAGSSGGSGGGGGGRVSSSTAGGTSTQTGTGGTGYGFAGGTGGSYLGGEQAGGGGGAGAVGQNAGTVNPKAGGVGTSVFSSWGLTTGTGQNVSGTVYYAGGGGAGEWNGLVGSGGSGGGGGPTGGGITVMAGTANTGGGGSGVSQGGTGGLGGSGLVIVRYPI
jgi:hypothetical protein